MCRRPLLLAACCALLRPGPAAAAPVAFRTEVMAVLSRAGCNMGACHGNFNGKGGLRLSLRGEDADFDLAALTRGAGGRRTDPLRPDDSLLLLKASGRVAHEGGRRFDAAAPEYALLRRWVAEGLRDEPGPRLAGLEVTPASAVRVEPEDRVALRVAAAFADGSRRDVTGLAVFESSSLTVRVGGDGVVTRQRPGEAVVLVRYLGRQVAVPVAFVPARPGFVWPDPPAVNLVDTHLYARQKALRLAPSGLAADHVFLRRAYLDALGVPPTVEEVRAFLADTRADKRERLVDALLRRPEFADFWALKWADLLRSEEKVLDRKGVAVLHGWLRRSFAENKPLDVLARELLGGQGSTYAEPPANFYRALRDPATRAEAAAQVFLGTRVQCAKCHNHPFDRWTQDDYHAFAALFARVEYRVVVNNRRDNLDKHEFDGEQVVYQSRDGELPHPRTGAPVTPRFLGGAAAPGGDRLRAVAAWATAADNPFFARAQANRVWAHLMGRGLVEPLDDFRDSNPASNPALLDALARELVESRFDLRHLVRLVMTSRAYQLSAVPNDTNGDDEGNFARAIVRPLQAEQLLDALAQAAGSAPRFAGFPSGTRAGQLPGVGAQRRGPASDAERFLSAFGKPVRSLSCECERSDDSTLAQAFQLVTGPLVNTLLAEPDNRVGRLLAAGKSDAEVVEELFLAALGRMPTAKEAAAAAGLLRRGNARRAAVEDLLWGLVNSKEFLLRQ